MAHIAIISGSIRTGNLTRRAASYLHHKVSNDSGMTSEIVDLELLALPMLEERFKFLPNPPEPLVKYRESILRSNGIAIVCPEYNHGYPAALKNALDSIREEYIGKPIGIITCVSGPSGGSFAMSQLRDVVDAFGATILPGSFMIRMIKSVIDENHQLIDEKYLPRFDQFVSNMKKFSEI